MKLCTSQILNITALICCLYAVLQTVNCISVPTGKLTPIEPAEPTPRIFVPLSARKLPAPVSEYTEENPEPPPLDPSFVPIRYDYIEYLRPHVVYVPMQIKYPHYQPKLEKYSKKYEKNDKFSEKLQQKYKKYPSHLQKKYIDNYLTSNKY